MLTFIAARLVSILIVLHRMPNIYLHVRDTHVHHLNYGIFLLAGVGAYLLFSSGPAAPRPPWLGIDSGRRSTSSACG